MRKFRFLTCGDRLTRSAETAQEGEVLSPSWISLRFLLRAVAGTTDMFCCIGEWRKMSSLRDSLISGFEP